MKKKQKKYKFIPGYEHLPESHRPILNTKKFKLPNDKIFIPRCEWILIDDKKNS